jgi:hypothetical protein
VLVDPPGLLGYAADRTFDRFRLRAAAQAVEVQLSQYRYRVVSGVGLRRAASGLMARAPGSGWPEGMSTGSRRAGTAR